MTTRVGRDDGAWKRIRKKVLAGASVCHICGLRLIFDAPPRSRWSPSVDHIVPLSSTLNMDPAERHRLALDESNLRPVHYGCNSARGNTRRAKPATSLPPRRTTGRGYTSREW
jgi:5-methylcytosine-specific restriction endonuclease McrA